MSLTLNSSDGNQTRRAAAPPPKSRVSASKEAHVAFKSAEGIALRGPLCQMTRHAATFEIYSPKTILNNSEALAEFSINFRGQVIYFGRAVIRSLVEAGGKVVCEVVLEEQHWLDLDVEVVAQSSGRILEEFGKFLNEWQKSYIVTSEFKVAIADMQTFLHDLQLWLNQVEISNQRNQVGWNDTFEKQTINHLAKPIISAIDTLIDRFESIVTGLPKESHPTFQAYLRRQLHPYLMASPFAHRTFNKPLGYAGDYEMVDMMIRPPEEGAGLFSKLINVWLLSQTPAEAHRNRITYLERKLIEETLRAKAGGKRLQVFNLGCGPADEIHNFAKTRNLAQLVDFCLVDFNAETLNVLKSKLNAKNATGRPLSCRTLKKSVSQIIKDGGKSLYPPSSEKYGYIYCAGLFDYLTDSVCKQLMEVFYQMLAPGGLLLATNASDALNASRPFRYSMEYILDWYLIYRNAHQFKQVLPDNLPEDAAIVYADATGANLFLEVRKSKNV